MRHKEKSNGGFGGKCIRGINGVGCFYTLVSGQAEQRHRHNVNEIFAA